MRSFNAVEGDEVMMSLRNGEGGGKALVSSGPTPHRTREKRREAVSEDAWLPLVLGVEACRLSPEYPHLHTNPNQNQLDRKAEVIHK